MGMRAPFIMMPKMSKKLDSVADAGSIVERGPIARRPILGTVAKARYPYPYLNCPTWYAMTTA